MNGLLHSIRVRVRGRVRGRVRVRVRLSDEWTPSFAEVRFDVNERPRGLGFPGVTGSCVALAWRSVSKTAVSVLSIATSRCLASCQSTAPH